MLETIYYILLYYHPAFDLKRGYGTMYYDARVPTPQKMSRRLHIIDNGSRRRFAL